MKKYSSALQKAMPHVKAAIKAGLLQAPDLRSVMTAEELKRWPKLQAPDIRGSKPSASIRLKKNPEYRYFLRIQKNSGPVMTWNGNRFTNNEPFHAFSKAIAAKNAGKELLKKFPILSDYKIFVEGKFHTAPVKDQKHRAIRGGSKSPRHNPSPRVEKALDDAAKKLEDFSGHKVTHLESAHSRSNQTTGLIVGELDLIGYRAKRDGKTERYGHHFKKNSRPLLAVTSDGKQLHIVGGRYEFTEAGIEDR